MTEGQEVTCLPSRAWFSHGTLGVGTAWKSSMIMQSLMSIAGPPCIVVLVSPRQADPRGRNLSSQSQVSPQSPHLSGISKCVPKKGK